MVSSSKNKKSSEAHVARDLLGRAHSPSTAESVFAEKVKQKPLLLYPTTTPTASDDRARRRLARLRKKEHFLRKQKPKPLSAKEKRKLGVYDIPEAERKYEIYEQLHALWVEYMQDLLGVGGGDGGRNQQLTVTAAGHGNLLATADYHGAILEVVRCTCVDRVGIKGIVVRDTKFTFVLITSKNELKTIPKDDTIFAFEIPLPSSPREGSGEQQPAASSPSTPLRFELHGERFRFRPADRANKKFKWQSLEGL